jgi:hypothetical protein
MQVYCMAFAGASPIQKYFEGRQEKTIQMLGIQKPGSIVSSRKIGYS